MRALLVTSRVTFVPGNYDDLVVGLARCPQIAGLLVLDNAAPALVLTACKAMAAGAVRLGWTLLANLLGRSEGRRRAAYARAGKPVWRLPTINSPEAHALLRRAGIDLVVNARTRFIYEPQVLAIPALGCINIHHGLLPEQRGTMCDLWALAEGRPAGFTIHRMIEQVDAGELLLRVEVSPGTDRDYLAYLRRCARRERAELERLLARIEAAGRLDGEPNVAPPGVRYRRNPDFAAVRRMRNRGMLL
ncbi:MAG: hypothetical protein KatS3mg102_1836 [Planctomycetota bacterium]|nr:MAG: hypothetical protein KatS3mg102_1836 [Planctomycetota bacterium]